MSTRRPAPRRVRLIDIANACSVSPATVSLALRENTPVNANTRARVLAELKRQGYVYNRGAANLRRQTSSTVALLINDISNPFFAEFAAGVDEALAQGGYVTLLGHSGESPDRQQRMLSSLMEHRPAGFILSPAELSDPRALQDLLGEHAHVLVFNRELSHTQWDFLVLNNRRGARLATEHLLKLGHRRIAFVGGHSTSSSCRQRRVGYTEAMRAAHIEPASGWLVECAPTRLDAAGCTGLLFAKDVPPPTAAVCYNDAVALGLMNGLAARNVRVGKEFAVTGFDDIAEAAVAAPTLTTVAADPRGLGKRAAEILLGRLEAPQQSRQRVVASVTLKIRDSTCPPSPTARIRGQ